MPNQSINPASIIIIEGDMDNYSGYSINGIAYVNEVNEWELNEAKNIAYSLGMSIEEALVSLL